MHLNLCHYIFGMGITLGCGIITHDGWSLTMAGHYGVSQWHYMYVCGCAVIPINF